MSAHVISMWRDEGTGRGDDRDGYQCSCGWWSLSGPEGHLKKVQSLAEINEKLAALA